jgi:ABC-type Mn2+/Zn2+ transport system ATPase subunit
MSGHAHHNHLVLDDVTICYRRRPAIHHLSCALPCGGLIGLVGPNGAGKSTLLQGILGWLPLTSGRVVWNGHHVPDRPGIVSWLGQRRSADLSFPADVGTVVATGRYARLGLWRGFSDADHAAVRTAMAEMGVAALADRPFAELSGGQQQRVLVARALASGAEVLLLDEPLTGLDEPAGRELLRRLRAWAAGGRLAVAVIHDLAAVRAWCDHALLINRGLIAFGPTAEVLDPARIEQCYRLADAATEAAHA